DVFSGAPARASGEGAGEYVTRRELEELAHRVSQLSAIQLQMMTQLSQILALQTTAVTGRLDGEASR
ncbi:hypothetical protein C1I97_30305, partial [Streptomyces sp. NTH33]|uniref:hypothetical protein n=1 Tax=Streptomyces sp. NTH33 TaxID=1735453 RepID=UPI000DB49963